MAIPGYQLRSLKFVLSSKNAPDMESTLNCLQKSISSSPAICHLLPIWPKIQRMPRKQTRITIRKAHNPTMKFVKHHIFEEFSYGVTFVDVHQPEETISSVLGSLQGQTHATCSFEWYYPGLKNHRVALATKDAIYEKPSRPRGRFCVRPRPQNHSSVRRLSCAVKRIKRQIRNKIPNGTVRSNTRQRTIKCSLNDARFGKRRLPLFALRRPSYKFSSKVAMGVPTFFKWLSVKYPKVLKDAVEAADSTEVEGISIPSNPNENKNGNGEFDNLYLDMNGIIHPCCHPEDAESPSNEDEMFGHIFDYIDRILNIVRPRKLLYMAIDGVAPRAKMNQQRMRRFKAAADVCQEEELYNELKLQFEAEGRPIPPPKMHWDSNVITPGTPFLDSVSKALQYYINDRMTSDPKWRNLKIILSDANCPGEGEHKIMNFVRSQRTYKGYDPNLRHCLYGADADLIMLGLATHEPHFMILREAILDAVELQKCYLCGKSGHLAADCQGVSDKDEDKTSITIKSTWKPLQFLHISILREYLNNEFQQIQAFDFRLDLERCIDDFVLLCFFVGNDFLPHLPSLSIQKGSIDQMLLLYQKIIPRLSDYLTDAGTLNLGPLKTFVEHIGKVEENVFQDELKRQNRMKQRRNENEAKKTPTSHETTKDEVDDNFAVLIKLKHNMDHRNGTDAEPNSFFGPPIKKQKVTNEEWIDQFKSEMRAKQKAATEIENVEDNVQLGVGSKSDWKNRYYSQKFNLLDEDMQNLEKFATCVATSYVEGLRWVLGYYYQGTPSWNWYYPYHYAPFASDVAAYGMKNQKAFQLGEPFKPFEQLMAVLPARSGHCLPSVYSKLMVEPNSPIKDFYPLKFKEDPDGKRYKWQWVVLLPFIDQKRLLTSLSPLESQLLPTEKNRNHVGVERIYVSQFHSLAQQIACVQLGQTKKERKQSILPDFGDSLWGVLQYSSKGLVNGVTIEGSEWSFGEVFRSKKSVLLSCEYAYETSHPHVCNFLKGTKISPQQLTDFDLQNDPSTDRRFNAGAAKRMIIGSLGRQGIVDKATVDSFFRHPRDTGLNHHQGIHSDNKYQAEMFGSRPRQYENLYENRYPQCRGYESSPQYTTQARQVGLNNLPSYRPSEFSGRPNEVPGRPNDVPGRFNDVIARSINFAHQPKEVLSRSDNSSGRPNDLPRRPPQHRQQIDLPKPPAWQEDPYASLQPPLPSIKQNYRKRGYPTNRQF